MNRVRHAFLAWCVVLLVPCTAATQVPVADTVRIDRNESAHARDSTHVAFSLNATPAGVVPDNPIEPLAGRIAGVQVVYGSAEPGTLPTLDLRYRAGLPASARPLYLFDGVPLAAPPFDLPSTDVHGIDVIPGLGGTARHGSRAAGGVVHFRSWRDTVFTPGRYDVATRLTLGTQWIAEQYPVAQHHHFRVGPDGGYVDASGNPVTAAQREPEPGGFADNPYPTPLYDHHDALFEPATLLGAHAIVRRGLEGGQLAVAAGHVRDNAAVRDGDGYRRTHARVSLWHALTDRLTLDVVGLYSLGTLPAIPDPRSYAIAATQLRPDIDLLAPSGISGSAPFIRADLNFVRNPLAGVNRLMDGERDRSIAGARLRRAGGSWFAFDVGAGFDRLRADVETRHPVVQLPGGLVTGFALETLERTRSRRTIDASATAASGRFGADVQGTLAVMLSRTDDDGEHAEVFEGSSGVTTWDMGDWGSIITLGGSAVHPIGLELAAGLRREKLPVLLNDEDRARFHHVASLGFDAARWLGADWLDRAALRVSSATASRTPTIDPLSGSIFVVVGNPDLRPEAEHELEVALEIRTHQRRRATVAFTRSRVRHAIFPIALIPGTQWQNAGEVAREVLEATVSLQPLRRADWEWTLELAADRPRHWLADFDRPLQFAMGTRLADGASIGEIWGRRLATDVSQLDPMHAGSADAFAVNDDGLLVPVGVGGSLDAPGWGTVVTIDGRNYPWGLPMNSYDLAKLGDRTPDLGLGFASTVRWRNLRGFVRFSGQVGGDSYDSAREMAHYQGTHPDVDQSGKPLERRKPADYYFAIPGGAPHMDWFVSDATHLKLRELALSWEPSAAGVSVALVGRNLATWFGSSGAGAEDFGLPRPRSVTLQLGYGFR